MSPLFDDSYLVGISLDNTMFVSAFGEANEGHTSPMYRLAGSPHDTLHRGFP